MKTTLSILVLLLAFSAMAAPDAIRKTKQDGDRCVTTWTRDGKVILVVTSSGPDDARQNVTGQRIMFNGVAVMSVTRFPGLHYRQYMTAPNSPVRAVLSVDDKGKITGAMLSDEHTQAIEMFTAEEGVLQPASGSELDRIRALAARGREPLEKERPETESSEE